MKQILLTAISILLLGSMFFSSCDKNEELISNEISLKSKNGFQISNSIKELTTKVETNIYDSKEEIEPITIDSIKYFENTKRVLAIIYYSSNDDVMKNMAFLYDISNDKGSTPMCFIRCLDTGTRDCQVQGQVNQDNTITFQCSCEQCDLEYRDAR